jgi:monofunctional glycosyltransferase
MVWGLHLLESYQDSLWRLALSGIDVAGERDGGTNTMRKIATVLAVALAAFVIWQLVTYPRLERLRHQNPETTAFMEQRKKELRRQGKSPEIEYRWVSYEQISPHLRSAVIVSEDSGFYQHDGIDRTEIEKILKEAWESKELGRGGSTITQQLVKNLYLSPSRNPWRKVKEIVIARHMEKKLGKKRILELYLNVVEFGERVYGAEAAARHYFGTSAAGLTPGQAALLAGALPNPRRMNPGSPGPYLRSRQEIILSRMSRWGYMAERGVAAAPEPEIEERAPEREAEPRPVVPEEVEEELRMPDESGEPDAESRAPAEERERGRQPEAEDEPLPEGGAAPPPQNGERRFRK